MTVKTRETTGKCINYAKGPIVKGERTWQNFSAEGHFHNAMLECDKDLELL